MFAFKYFQKISGKRLQHEKILKIFLHHSREFFPERIDGVSRLPYCHIPIRFRFLRKQYIHQR